MVVYIGPSSKRPMPLSGPDPRDFQMAMDSFISLSDPEIVTLPEVIEEAKRGLACVKSRDIDEAVRILYTLRDELRGGDAEGLVVMGLKGLGVKM